MKKILLVVATFATVICIASQFKTPQLIKLNPAQRLYASIMTYAKQYDIPLHVAFNVARIETGYKGPFHDDYNHKQTSRAGALGPMQIMPQYASYYAGQKEADELNKILNNLSPKDQETAKQMMKDFYKR